MYKKTLQKPDGRNLILYSQGPIDEGFVAPSPSGSPSRPNPHLRWHPLRGEWVSYASHRQDRTFLPPPKYNPLAPMTDPNVPTELPSGNYEVAVFENLFPALSPHAENAPRMYVPSQPALGSCEVVVFTQSSEGSFGSLPLERIELILEVWADRYKEVGSREYIQYVMPFENRGVEVGVTLHHPHGQIYAYPFIPPIAQTEIAQQDSFFKEKGTGLLEHMIENEIKDAGRVLYLSDEAIAFVPICARYPYEVWVAPRRRVPSLELLTQIEVQELARALKTVLLKYDGLWKRPFPYLMVLRQAPTDGKLYDYFHFHFEFSPPYRTPDKLKFLAGTELGAGMFANDSLPEAKAAELRAVEVQIEAR